MYTKHTYHSQKEAKFWVQVNIVPISEQEVLLSVLFGCEDNINLLCCHRQYRQLNSVELIKATP